MTLTLDTVADFHRAATSEDLPSGREATTDAERVAMIGQLEDLKNTLAGLQGDLAVDLDASQRAQQATDGIPSRRQGQGVASQVGLARKESPHRGQMLLGLAKQLRDEMPHTHAALHEGCLCEYRATLIVRETACLSLEDRGEVDRLICADPDTLDGVGTRRLVGILRSHAQRLDVAAVVRRRARAVTERRVSLRPAPDGMVYLSGLVPMEQGIAAFKTLTDAATATIAAGDERSKGQLMADLLIERLTGQSQATDVSVTVDLTLSDATLFGGSNEPAHTDGHGPVPAEVARHLIAASLDAETMTWIRRLYTDPAGHLVALTSKQRFHTGGITDFLRLRDQGVCRTPWCDAPIAHTDHITPVDQGGATTTENGQGLCVACNMAKQAPGWRQHLDPDAERHTVETTTPTGHHYRSIAPRAPTPARPPPPTPAEPPASPTERRIVDMIYRFELTFAT